MLTGFASGICRTFTCVNLTAQPLLFVDIDGVISLFGFDPQARPPGSFHAVDGVVHFISSTAAGHLHELAGHFELVWCSGWEEKANEYLPHLLGLPGELPYLTFERNPGRVHAHWKLDAIERHAAGRPLAWIDDALDDSCRAWARSRGEPTLLVETEPPAGIGPRHVEELIAFATTWSARLV